MFATTRIKVTRLDAVCIAHLKLRILRVLQDGVDHVLDLLLIVLVVLDAVLTQSPAGRVDDVSSAVRFPAVGEVRVRAGLGRLGVGAVMLPAAGPTAVEGTAIRDGLPSVVDRRLVLETVSLRILLQVTVTPALALAVGLAVLHVLDLLDRVAHLFQLPAILLQRLLHDLILDQQVHRDLGSQPLVARRGRAPPRRVRLAERVVRR